MKLLLKLSGSLFLIIPLLFSTASYSQKVKFKEIKLRPDSRIFNTKDTTIIYPVVVAQNTAISKKINDEVRDAVIGDYDGKLSLPANLKIQTKGGLINLSYEVIYNKSDLLSLGIFMEGCGAYCSTYYEYLNFDLKTGRRLNISDIILADSLESFNRLVAMDKTRNLNQYKKSQIEAFKNKEIDSTEYYWIIEQVDSNCINTLDVSKFALTNSYIEIFDDCYFPHVIRALQPTYNLNYPLKNVEAFLNPRIRKQLLKK